MINCITVSFHHGNVMTMENRNLRVVSEKISWDKQIEILNQHVVII